jgi:hypothetical protein
LVEVEDLVRAPFAASGDEARLEVELRRSGDTYLIELITTGFPPGAEVPFPAPAGGVRLNTLVFGRTGVGWPAMTLTRAALTLWGRARVSRNGEVVAHNARLFAAALVDGIHADDGTFRMLPEARPEDLELWVQIDELPPEADPRGFMAIGFDDVDIQVGGIPVPGELYVEVRPHPPPPLLPGEGTGGSGLEAPAPSVLYGYGSAAAVLSSSRPVATQQISPPAPPSTSQVIGPEFVTPGVPASPPVANSGVGTSGAQTPIATPPANAQTATALPQTPSPLNAPVSNMTGAPPTTAAPNPPFLPTPAPLNDTPTPVPPGGNPAPTPFPQSPAPLNASPSPVLPGGNPGPTPLPQTPTPLNANPVR